MSKVWPRGPSVALFSCRLLFNGLPGSKKGLQSLGEQRYTYCIYKPGVHDKWADNVFGFLTCVMHFFTFCLFVIIIITYLFYSLLKGVKSVVLCIVLSCHEISSIYFFSLVFHISISYRPLEAGTYWLSVPKKVLMHTHSHRHKHTHTYIYINVTFFND